VNGGFRQGGKEPWEHLWPVHTGIPVSFKIDELLRGSLEDGDAKDLPDYATIIRRRDSFQYRLQSMSSALR